MQLDELLWVDWLGIALAVYGLTAGAVRGLTQQFSRLLVWALALVGASALGLVLGSNDEAGSGVSLALVLQLVAFLGVGFGLGSLQRRIIRGNQAKTLADAGLGAVCGLALAAVTWLVGVSSYVHFGDDVATLAEAETVSVLETLSSYANQLPGAAESEWLSLAEPGSTRESHP